MKKNFSIAIIGAGPAGLFAAEILSADGFKVDVFERKPSPARKFLMAGRGGLNLTHSEPLEKFLPRYREAMEWIAPMVNGFSPQDLRTWADGLGAETFSGTSGRIFPRAMKASPLLREWQKRLEKQGVTLYTRHDFKGWRGNELLFMTTDGEKNVTADAVLLALGGGSWPKLGSDASWVDILKKHDIDTTPIAPANCGFCIDWQHTFREKYAGTPLKNVLLNIGGKQARGEAVITAQGIEGGCVYALSAEIRKTLMENGNATVLLDLKPDVPLEKLTQKISAPRGGLSLSNFLRRHAGMDAVSTALLRACNPDAGAYSSAPLAAAIKNIPLCVTGIFPIDRAISSAGGIMRDALDDNLMLKKMPGVFVAGEMIDWEAPTGGYLLQGCFSTAARAAMGIRQYLSA